MTRPQGVTQATRNAVLARDEETCQRCGCRIDRNDYSLQHRRPRGAGGSKLPHINEAPNLLTLCGSATTGCHGWVESFRIDARGFGWSIPLLASYAPSQVPYQGWSRGVQVWFQPVGLFRVRLPQSEALAQLVALGIREES